MLPGARYMLPGARYMLPGARYICCQVLDAMCCQVLHGWTLCWQVQDSVRSMYQGAGQDDLHPFVEVILMQEAIKGDASPIISELIGFAVSQGEYPVSGNSE